MQFLDDVRYLTYTISMITTITGKNQVTIPADIARALDLKPGTRLSWEINADGALVATPQPSRAQLAAALMGEGRKYLRPDEDVVQDLIIEREMEEDDLETTTA